MNQEPERLNDAALRTLDSSLKKNQAFIKKCAALGEASKASLLLPSRTSPEPLAPSLSLTPGQASLLQEMSKLNLSRFVEEVAGSVAEARLKLTDLPAALQACRRYREI